MGSKAFEANVPRRRLQLGLSTINQAGRKKEREKKGDEGKKKRNRVGPRPSLLVTFKEKGGGGGEGGAGRPWRRA